MSETPDKAASVERALMDRFRDRANRVPEKPPRQLLQRAIALLLSVAVVVLVLTGFDKFLTSVQKFMEIEAEQDAPAAPAPTDPIPAFVVPDEISPPPPADQDPRPSQPPAPDNAPATPR